MSQRIRWNCPRCGIMAPPKAYTCQRCNLKFNGVYEVEDA